jgi:hypothetical protein
MIPYDHVHRAAIEALAAVAKLHRERWPGAPVTHCAHDGHRWPCPTLRAITDATAHYRAVQTLADPTSTGAAS